MAKKGQKTNRQPVNNTAEKVVLTELGLNRTVEVNKNKYTMIDTEDGVFSGSES